MRKIKAFITFPNDSAAGRMPETYIMELPDFMAYEPDYTEENRKTIKQFYSELADADCSVVFAFEMPEAQNLPMLNSRQPLEKAEMAALMIAGNIAQSWGSSTYGHEGEIARNARALAEAVLEEVNK